MRVIAGSAKGRRLGVPRGLAVRPSGSRLRESAFGLLEHRGAVRGARVLDLFAGSGALGIEALSRGAQSLTAVEQDRAVARLLAENLGRCGLAGRARVIVGALPAALAGLGGEPTFDLVLLDPPYDSGLAAPTLHALALHGLLDADALVLIEHRHGTTLEWPAGHALELERRLGDSALTLLRVAAERDPSGVEAHGIH